MSKYTIIPSSAEVDNITLNKNVSGEIECLNSKNELSNISFFDKNTKSFTNTTIADLKTITFNKNISNKYLIIEFITYTYDYQKKNTFEIHKNGSNITSNCIITGSINDSNNSVLLFNKTNTYFYCFNCYDYSNNSNKVAMIKIIIDSDFTTSDNITLSGFTDNTGYIKNFFIYTIDKNTNNININ